MISQDGGVGALPRALSWRTAAAIGGVLLALCLTRFYGYLLFHTTVEMFTVVVSWGVFFLAWHTRRFHENHYLLFVGIASLFVGILDLLHTLAYKGMGVFPDSSDVPTQLWIAGRYLHSISYLAAPAFLRRRLDHRLTFLVLGAATALLAASIFWFRVFPVCHIEGQGLTTFKVASEYAVMVILIGAGFYLFRRRHAFEKTVFQALCWSIALTIAAGAAFTLYTDVYGAFNMVGHLLRFAAVCLVYQALLVTGLMRPNLLLFRSLTQSEEALRKSNGRLESAVAALAAGEERYRAFVGSSSEGICRIEFEVPVPVSEDQQGQIELLRDRGRLAECNAVYARMHGLTRPEEIVGSSLAKLLSGSPELLLPFVSSGYRLIDAEFGGTDSSGAPRWIVANFTSLVEDGRLIRMWGVHRDDTERKRAALEREHLIAELRRALAEVQRLGGLLPICAQCKKIRDDKGYWNQVEAYIAERANVEFSHGICPDCLKHLYPDLYDSVVSGKQE